MENVGAGNLSMPEQEMHTTAFWLHFPGEFLARFSDLTPVDVQGALVAVGNLIQTTGALLLMCDPRDLGVAITEDVSQGVIAPRARTFEPDLFLYDSYPGGIGQSQPLYAHRERLLKQSLDLAAACPCEAGCPSCVGPIGEVGQNGKPGAVRILSVLCEGGSPVEAN